MGCTALVERAARLENPLGGRVHDLKDNLTALQIFIPSLRIVLPQSAVEVFHLRRGLIPN